MMRQSNFRDRNYYCILSHYNKVWSKRVMPTSSKIVKGSSEQKFLGESPISSGFLTVGRVENVTPSPATQNRERMFGSRTLPTFATHLGWCSTRRFSQLGNSQDWNTPLESIVSFFTAIKTTVVGWKNASCGITSTSWASLIFWAIGGLDVPFPTRLSMG